MHLGNNVAGSFIEEMDQNSYGWAGPTNAAGMFNFDRTLAKQQVAASKQQASTIVDTHTGMVWEAEQDKPKSPTFLNLIEELQRASAPPTQVPNEQMSNTLMQQQAFDCDANQQAPQQPQSLNSINNVNNSHKNTNARNPFVMGGRRHTLSSVQQGDNVGSRWLKTHARPPAQPNSPYSGYAQKRQSSQPKLPQYSGNLTGDDPLNEVMDFLGRTDINAPASMQRGYSPNDSVLSANEGHRPLTSMGRRATYNGGKLDRRLTDDIVMDGMLQDSSSAAMLTDPNSSQRTSFEQTNMFKVQDLMMPNRGPVNLNVVPQDLWSALQRNQGDSDMQQQRSLSVQDEHLLNSGFFQSDSNMMFGHSPQNGDYSSPNSVGEMQNKGKKCRRRRTFAELSREFTCTYPDCARPYASAHSLQQHIRIKHTMTHPTLFKDKKKKSKDSNVDEIDEDDECTNTGEEGDNESDAESLGEENIKVGAIKRENSKNEMETGETPVEPKGESKKKSFASNIMSALHKKKPKDKPRAETIVAA